MARDPEASSDKWEETEIDDQSGAAHRLAGPTLPLRINVGRRGRKLRALLGARREGGVVSIRRFGQTRDLSHSTLRANRHGLALLPP